MNRHTALTFVLMFFATALWVTGCPENDDSAQRSPQPPPSATSPAAKPGSTTAASPMPTTSPASPVESPTPSSSPSPAAAANPSAKAVSPDRDASDSSGVIELSDSADASGESDGSDDSADSTTLAVEQRDAFKIQITLVRDEVTEYDEPTYFIGDQAIELAWSGSGKLLATYNLADMSWWEASSGNLFTIADCVDWAQRSTETTRTALDESPDSITKRFVLAMMEPELEVADGDGTFTVSNEFYTMTYSTDGPIEPSRLKRFLAYDRLKNYRKSMLFRESPPFMRLKIDDLLEARALFPHRMELKVTTPGAESQSVITMSIESVTEEEMNTLDAYIE